MITTSENVSAPKPKCFGKMYSLTATECHVCDELEDCKMICSSESAPEPVETETVETETVETEPVETEPVETEPVETEPVETEPAISSAPSSLFRGGTIAADVFDLLKAGSVTKSSLIEAIELKHGGRGKNPVGNVLSKLRKLNLLTKEGKGKDAKFGYTGE